MKVTTKQFADESFVLQVDCSAAEVDLADSDYDFDQPVRGSVTFTQVEDQSVVARGEVATSAQTRCVRCLEPVRVELRAQVTAVYEHDPELLKPDAQFHGGDEEIQAYFDGESIDPSSQLREALLLELPPLPLCDDACKGLCMHCGTNLNSGKCDCQSEPGGDKPWKDALKQFKLDS
jgi:uncharacterized protein